jgi:hypothetical protein
VAAIAEKLAALKTTDNFQDQAKRVNLDEAMTLLNRTGCEPPQEDDEIS